MKYILFILFTLSISALNAQQIKNYAILPASASYSTEAIQGYWSVGEVENGNRQVDDVIIVQGFSKSNLLAEITSIPKDFISKINVFPNPTQDYLNIEWEGTIDSNDLSYKLYNAQGVLIQTNHLATINLRSKIDLHSLVDGTYVLHIFSSRITQPISIRILKTQSE